jgi:hypothetical protein
LLNYQESPLECKIGRRFSIRNLPQELRKTNCQNLRTFSLPVTRLKPRFLTVAD